jgi:hypothetical protein
MREMVCDIDYGEGTVAMVIWNYASIIFVHFFDDALWLKEPLCFELVCAVRDGNIALVDWMMT